MLMQLAVGLAIMNVLAALILVFIYYPSIMLGLFFLIGAYVVGHVVVTEYYLWRHQIECRLILEA